MVNIFTAPSYYNTYNYIINIKFYNSNPVSNEADYVYFSVNQTGDPILLSVFFTSYAGYLKSEGSIIESCTAGDKFYIGCLTKQNGTTISRSLFYDYFIWMVPQNK